MILYVQRFSTCRSKSRINMIFHASRVGDCMPSVLTPETLESLAIEGRGASLPCLASAIVTTALPLKADRLDQPGVPLFPWFLILVALTQFAWGMIAMGYSSEVVVPVAMGYSCRSVARQPVVLLDSHGHVSRVAMLDALPCKRVCSPGLCLFSFARES